MNNKRISLRAQDGWLLEYGPDTDERIVYVSGTVAYVRDEQSREELVRDLEIHNIPAAITYFRVVSPKCIYCKDTGIFGDCLSGNESYCTCDAGKTALINRK